MQTKKRILIINNNLDVGGIQKSLVNFLKSYNENDISLFLFNEGGKYLHDIPNTVKIIKAPKRYITLGMTKKELRIHPFYFMLKAIMMLVSRLFTQRIAIKILGIGIKKIKGFDVAISFSPLFHAKSFTNGVAPFTLDKVIAPLKICFIHNNYLLSGTRSTENDRLYSLFDRLVCCSESVRTVFVSQIPYVSQKTFSMRNFYDTDITSLAFEGNFCFDKNYLNLVMVARLSPEKNHIGVFNAILRTKRTDLRLYVIGDGPLFSKLETFIDDHNLKERVFFLGETANPYPAMKNADYLICNSFHEAAPIVFDEAHILGLPVISSRTTSANEMLYNGIDIIYDSEEELVSILSKIKKRDNGLFKHDSFDNKDRIICFDNIIKNESL